MPTIHRALAAFTAATAAGAGLVAVAPAGAAPAAEVAITDFGFDAASYGSKTTGNPTADSDATALSHLPCTRKVPRDDRNFLAEAGDGDGVSLRGVATHNFTRRKNGTVSANSVVNIDRGRLAGGDVRFTNLRGRVKAFHNARGYHVKTVSDLGSLTVLGDNVPLPVGGRQFKVPLPGGMLIVNRRIEHVRNIGANGAVNVLRFVSSTDNTVEKVGRAFARIDGQIEGGLFGGAAWGSDARVGDRAALGRAALQPMPCPGTRGKVKETSTGEARLDFGFIGARRSFAYGVQRDNSATGDTRSVGDSARFGGGALKFRNIRAKANVTRQADGDVIRTAKGSGIGRILVNGEEIQTPRAGVPRKVAGLGTFTVRKVNKTPNGIEVTGVIVRLFNGTPKVKSDDTVVNLANAKLKIKKG